MSKFPKLLAMTAVTSGLVFAGVAPLAAQGLGLGRPALPEEIAAWDVVVLPDGTGLREGRGTVYDGEELWVNNCAACHGDFGEGAGAWPVIVGGSGTLMRERPVKTVESYWPYLSTVYDYVHRSMPFGNAQSLGYDEVYAILAYILYSGGLVDDDFELSHENFTSVTLPNADGFYPDDRDAVELPLFTQSPCMSDCRDAPQVTFRATDLNVTPVAMAPANIPGWTPNEAAVAAAAAASGGSDAASAVTASAAPAATEATPAAAEASAAPDPALVAEGEALWRQCAACHKVGDNARNGTGPALNGIIGRVAGTHEGFRYSSQMTEAGSGGLVWTAETLDAFLENPSQVVPRNRMAFRGVSDPADRAALIAYLSTY